MNIEDAIVEEMSTIPGIDGKVYPANAPRTDKNNQPIQAPYIIYLSTYGLRDKSLDGYQTSKSVEIELNVVGQTYPEMKAIAAQVMDKIISFERRVIGTDGPFVQELKYDKPVEMYEPLPKLHRCVIDCEFHIS